MKRFNKPPYLLYLFCCIMVVSMSGCATTGKGIGDEFKMRQNMMEERAEIKALGQKGKEKKRPNHLALARVLSAKGFYDIALVQLREAEKINGKSPEIFYLRGVCLSGKRKYKDAGSQFRAAIAADPQYSASYAGLGIVYDMAGDHEKAVDCYKKAIELNPANPSYYNNLGASFMSAGNYEEAVKYFKESIALKPDSARAVNNLGLAYGMLGQYDKAYEMFERGGSKASACNNMGYVYQLKGKRTKAVEMYQKAIQLDPDFKQAKESLEEIERNKRTAEQQNVECRSKKGREKRRTDEQQNR